MLEWFMNIASTGKRRVRPTGPINAEIRHSRICYDHLAGEVAVQLLERIRENEFITGSLSLSPFLCLDSRLVIARFMGL
jgi:hypothetical protein